MIMLVLNSRRYLNRAHTSQAEGRPLSTEVFCWNSASVRGGTKQELKKKKKKKVSGPWPNTQHAPLPSASAVQVGTNMTNMFINMTGMSNLIVCPLACHESYSSKKLVMLSADTRLGISVCSRSADVTSTKSFVSMKPSRSIDRNVKISRIRWYLPQTEMFPRQKVRGLDHQGRYGEGSRTPKYLYFVAAEFAFMASQEDQLARYQVIHVYLKC